MRLIALGLLFLAGCSIGVTPTDIKYPHIERPERPELSIISVKDLATLPLETRAKLLDNDWRLKSYIEKLEAGIDAYNEWAKEHSK